MNYEQSIHSRLDHCPTPFALCITNDGYPAALEVGKLYRIVPDVEASARGYLRVIDESGEDYAYKAERFFPLDLPRELEEALQSAA